MRERIIFLLVLWFTGSFLFNACLAQEKEQMKALMIIAPNDFRDEELFQPKEILEESGIKVTVASRSLSSARGMLGGKITPDIKIDDVDVSNFDAIVFVGGRGASMYWDDSVAHKIARQAHSLNKVLAAICIAPVTLANSGLLKGKRATVWSSEATKIKLKGAIYTGKPLEKDGNIITASGPAAARDFGKEIVEALLK